MTEPEKGGGSVADSHHPQPESVQGPPLLENPLYREVFDLFDKVPFLYSGKYMKNVIRNTVFLVHYVRCTTYIIFERLFLSTVSKYPFTTLSEYVVMLT